VSASSDDAARRTLPRAALALALTVAIVWLAAHRSYLAAGHLEAQLQRLGLWAPAAFVALYAVATVLFVPGSVMTLLGGALFGPLWGTLWNLLGAVLGATLAFEAARYLAADVVRAAPERGCGRWSKGSRPRDGGSWRSCGWCRCSRSTCSITHLA
jgi:uncharacterized membrane protein YdjX (TVP38/TMEM64 family)